jgi:hypothetical protein
MPAKLPFLFRLYKSGGVYVNSTIVDHPWSSDRLHLYISAAKLVCNVLCLWDHLFFFFFYKKNPVLLLLGRSPMVEAKLPR